MPVTEAKLARLALKESSQLERAEREVRLFSHLSGFLGCRLARHLSLSANSTTLCPQRSTSE